MKRLPLLFTVLAVVALSASLAYWGLQLFKPAQRAIAAPPLQAAAPPGVEAAMGLFGGQVSVAAVSNYQLRGVVAARGMDSAAIVAVDGKPAMAFGVGREVVPGVTVKEVHDKYVLLSEGGVSKRIELASDVGVPSSTMLPPSPGLPPTQQPIPVPAPQVQQQQMQPQQVPPAPPGPPNKSSVSPVIAVPGFDRQRD